MGLWLTVLLLLMAYNLAAQPNGAGTRKGTVDGATDDTLVMHTEKGSEWFDRQQIAAVQVHRGRNAFIGLAAGGGAGLGLGGAARPKPGQLHVVSTGVVMGVGAAAGALASAAIGAAMPAGGWHEIYRKESRAMK